MKKILIASMLLYPCFNYGAAGIRGGARFDQPSVNTEVSRQFRSPVKKPDICAMYEQGPRGEANMPVGSPTLQRDLAKKTLARGKYLTKRFDINSPTKRQLKTLYTATRALVKVSPEATKSKKTDAQLMREFASGCAAVAQLADRAAGSTSHRNAIEPRARALQADLERSPHRVLSTKPRRSLLDMLGAQFNADHKEADEKAEAENARLDYLESLAVEAENPAPTPRSGSTSSSSSSIMSPPRLRPALAHGGGMPGMIPAAGFDPASFEVIDLTQDSPIRPQQSLPASPALLPINNGGAKIPTMAMPLPEAFAFHPRFVFPAMAAAPIKRKAGEIAPSAKKARPEARVEGKKPKTVKKPSKKAKAAAAGTPTINTFFAPAAPQ